eukprot:gene16029-20305_t
MYHDIQDFMLHNGPMAYIYQTCGEGFRDLTVWCRLRFCIEITIMLTVWAKQLGSILVTLMGLLALTFFMGRMLPVDPV